MEKKTSNKSSAAFKLGAVSLAFLIIGYQAALFIHRAAVLRIEANRDSPDTVYVYLTGETGESAVPPPKEAGKAVASLNAPDSMVRRDAPHTAAVERVRRATRRTESFRFNPNTASSDELVRLGFSEKQAAAIINYRVKGGRFRRKEDFARSFVVADSVFRRLEPYIDIPKLDINTADSAAFDALPGIGPYYAAQMVAYREKIGAYSRTEQLMDIRNFDRERYDGLKDLITCGEDDAPE